MGQFIITSTPIHKITQHKWMKLLLIVIIIVNATIHISKVISINIWDCISIHNICQQEGKHVPYEFFH
jgi:hypothetical protein